MLLFSLMIQAAVPVPSESRPPVPLTSPEIWVTPGDYPPEALRDQLTGVTGFAVDVAADGTVNSCQIAASSGHAVLDNATCGLVQARARFRPATDARGRPVAGSYVNRVRWVLPDGGSLPVIELPNPVMGSGYPRPPALAPGVRVEAGIDDLAAAGLGPDEFLVARYEVDVASDGTIAGCRLSPATGNEAVNARTCVIVTAKARFVPAQGLDGMPTAGRFAGALRWGRMPRPDVTAQVRRVPPPPPGTGRVTISYDARGNVVACVTDGSLPGAARGGMCARPPLIPPQVDGEGRPAGKTIRVTTIIEHDPED